METSSGVKMGAYLAQAQAFVEEQNSRTTGSMENSPDASPQPTQTATDAAHKQDSMQSEPNFIFPEEEFEDVENEFGEIENEERGRGRGRNVPIHLSYYLPLYQAARDGEWKKGKEFIDEDPDSITAIISIHGATALHIAASYGQSEFVEKIVKLMPRDALEIRDNSGCTALHCIAVGGTVKAAMALVEKNHLLPIILNHKFDTPLYHLCATMPLISVTEREMVGYLCSVTRDEYPSFCFSGGGAPNLIIKLLAAGHLDICLELFQKYPRLATSAIVEKGDDLIIGLCAATSEFPSGYTLGFFERFIYKTISSFAPQTFPSAIQNRPSPYTPSPPPGPPPGWSYGSDLSSPNAGQMQFPDQPRSTLRMQRNLRQDVPSTDEQEPDVQGDIGNPSLPRLPNESDSNSQHVGLEQEQVQEDIENPPLPRLPEDQINSDSQHVGQMQPRIPSRRVTSKLVHEQEPVPGDIENPPPFHPDGSPSGSQHGGHVSFSTQTRMPSRRVFQSKLGHKQEPVPGEIENPPPPFQRDGISSYSQHVGRVPFSVQPRIPSRRDIPPELLYEQESASGYMENAPVFFSTPDNLKSHRAQKLRQQSFLVQRRTCFGRVIHWLYLVFWLVVIAPLNGVPLIKRAHDMRFRHHHASALLHYICQLVIQQKTVDLLSLFQERYVLHTAAERGIVEIVAVFLRYLPDMIMLSKDSNETLLHVAVENRREKIFNLLMELRATSTSLVFMKLESGENIMHLAAKLAPSLQLNSVSGPALQMQRELQWFKEVEKLFNNTDKRLKNKDGKTPRELFTIEHKELKAKGEQWMRDTSNSCMVVTTLIATIAFAAAFTVPGGNDSQKGTPLFLNKGSFMVFAISDALALFSSVTSLIMFLAILTARYAEEDFLISLPRKLIIGLCSLFVAIATMMIAFGAGLSSVLGEKLEWIYIPVILLGCFPVALFGMLQLPLLVQMIRSTYGRSIFYRPGDCYYRNLAYMKLQ